MKTSKNQNINYFSLRKGITLDERNFWNSPATESLYQTAKNWPSGRGLYYVARALWVRQFWPVLRPILVMTALSAATAALVIFSQAGK